jgi:transcription factor IIIB subunit 2
MLKRDLSDLRKYQTDHLQSIESSLVFQNQQLQGKIVDKQCGISFYGGAQFINNYRYKKVEQLASQIGQMLGINQHIVHESLLLFKLVQSKNWIQGRSTSLVVLACLYIKCRLRETGHLMVDFSSLMGIDIFLLSKLYLKLCRFLHINLQLNDPSIFVPRFARKFPLSPEQEKMMQCSVLRILGQMQRDWLGQGR